MNDAPNANAKAQVPVEDAAAVPPASEAPPAAAPPPAAALVRDGTANEEALQLRRELESERKARRDAETKAAELERDRQNLLRPPPAKEKPKRKFATLMNHPWVA